MDVCGMSPRMSESAYCYGKETPSDSDLTLPPVSAGEAS